MPKHVDRLVHLLEDITDPRYGMIPPRLVLTLIRRERALLRRKVKGLRWCRPISIRLQGYNDAINDVLKVLED